MNLHVVSSLVLRVARLPFRFKSAVGGSVVLSIPWVVSRAVSFSSAPAKDVAPPDGLLI